MDIILSWQFSRLLGCEKLLAILRQLFPQFQLYSISDAWVTSPDYIAKARGRHGDVIVSWIENIQIKEVV